MDILFFFAGVAFYYFKTIYPLLLISALLFFRPHPVKLLWFIAAILWSFTHQWFVQDKNMPRGTSIRDASIEGRIISIPQQQPTKTQFQFAATSLNHQPIKATFLLYCYGQCALFKAKQYWQFQVHLKKPQNFSNPGSFDYQSWLHARHIEWVGTIVSDKSKQLKKPFSPYGWILYQTHLAERLEKMHPDPQALGIIEALTLGLVNHIHPAQWELFRRTGTTHLFDISGEHIALIAGFGYWLFKCILKYTGTFCLYYPAPKIASLAALALAATYAFITGFAVPTQRAFITCFFIFIRHFANQRFSIWQAWRYSLLTVLLFEPHSVFMQGFYFSFLAVAILILINQRYQFNRLQKSFAMQLACLLGLMPLTLYWFSYGSLNGFIANMVAIPWVSFIIVPAALLITFLSPWFTFNSGLFLLNHAVILLLTYLKWVDSLAWMNIQFTFVSLLPALALIGGLFLLSCVPLPTLLPATVTFIIASFFPHHEKIKIGEARVDVLDVGQGFASVIRTATHTLIYDTGMKFYRSNDIGQLVIIPYLRYLGIKQLDKIIISHSDLDHRGGLSSLQKAYPQHQLVVDNPSFYKQGIACHDFLPWQWDGVLFQFFPIKTYFKNKNNHSCVLQIRTQKEQLLLSGDIEKKAEQYLVDTYGPLLKSTVLAIPHHGSRTSSSAPFIKTISPDYAIASYGLNNQYHFPHPQVIKMYQQHHVPVYSTTTCGMTSIHLSSDRTSIRCHRK